MKKYNISADFLRILAAFFVIFSHSTDRFVLYTVLKGSTAWNVIYYMNTLSRVAVPIFVILSGYLLLNKDKIQTVKAFYYRRFSRVLYPFIIWLIIYYGWTVYWDQRKLTFDFIMQTLWHGDLWHLYFLVIILELYLITPLLEHFNATKNRKKQTLLFWSLLALSVLCSILVVFHIDVKNTSLTMFIPYIGIFYAGYYLRDVKITKIKAGVCFTLYFLLAFITNYIAKGDMNSFIVFNTSLTLLPMTIFLFLGFKNIHQLFNGEKVSEQLTKIIVFTGRSTFGIYLLHFLVLDLVLKYFHLLPWELHAPLILYACLPAIITFVISFAIIAPLRLLPYAKYVVG